MEAKGSSPKKSSPWRVTNAKDRSQHSCTLRRRPLRPDTRTTKRDLDATPDLTSELRSTQPPAPRFQRYDGFDPQLHHGYGGTW